MNTSEPIRDTINLSATHHILVTQDKAEVHVSLSAKADSAPKAQIELKKLVKKLQASAKGHGMAAQVTQRYFEEEHEAKGKEQRMAKTGKTIAHATATVIAYDFEALDKLIGDIAKDKLGLITGSATSISSKLRASMEDKLTEEAIAKFSSRAKLAAKAFGFKKHTIGSINLGAAADERGGGVRMMAMSASPSAGSAMMESVHDDESGYVSARDERLSLSVSGSVILG
jgi:predicted secreted protein